MNVSDVENLICNRGLYDSLYCTFLALNAFLRVQVQVQVRAQFLRWLFLTFQPSRVYWYCGKHVFPTRAYSGV
jgi:hypothetical protein